MARTATPRWCGAAWRCRRSPHGARGARCGVPPAPPRARHQRSAATLPPGAASDCAASYFILAAMTIRIACVGHASLDHVFEVDALPTRPTKTPARSHRPGTGGMGFNAAVAAARLGATVRMIGRVGSEPAVQLLRERLRAEGIEDRALECVPGATTSVSAIVVDARGERQIFNHRGEAI